MAGSREPDRSDSTTEDEEYSDDDHGPADEGDTEEAAAESAGGIGAIEDVGENFGKDTREGLDLSAD